MLNLLKKLFAPQPRDGDLWAAMEKMDPLLSYQRFLSLKLTKQQRPLVQGLLDGTTKPCELEAVREWVHLHQEEPDGIHALVFGLQSVLASSETKYLFEDQVPTPSARLPWYQDEHSPTVLFNDREHHLQITSVAEFVDANNIGDYVLEALTPSELRNRIQSRLQRYQGITASPPAHEPWVHEGRKVSITIEASATDAGELGEAVTAAQITAALHAEGIDVPSDDVLLEAPIEKLGLYNVPVRRPEQTVSISVWVVPSVGSEES